MEINYLWRSGPPWLRGVITLGWTGWSTLLHFAMLVEPQRVAGSFISSVLTSRIDQLDCFMDRPFNQVLKEWQTIVELRALAFPATTDALSSLLYKQIISTGTGDKTKTALDMVYLGLEDGRFLVGLAHL